MSTYPEPETEAHDISTSDADDLMAGRRGGGPSRRLLALGLLVAIALGAALFLSRGGEPTKSSAAGTVKDGGDLGSLSDARALGDRLAPELAESDSPPASVPPGSVPCDDSEAALPQDQAELVYSAKLDWEGTPSVVLGYRVKGPSLQRLLLVMAEADCRLIVTQSF